MAFEEQRGKLKSSLMSRLAPFLTTNGWQALHNLSALLIATGVAQVCGLISVLLLTRALGAERYGVLAFALTIQNYLMILGSAGLRPIILRELIRRPEALSQLWTAYITITGSLGVALALMTIAAAVFVAPTMSEQVVLTFIAVGNIAACVTPLPFFDYRHAQSKSALIMTSAELIALLVLLALNAANTLSLPVAAIVFTLKWIGSTAWLWLGLSRRLPDLHWDWLPHEPLKLLRTSWILLLSGLLGTIPLTAGIVLVRLYHGESAAGVLGLGMYAPRALLLLVGQLNRILQPHIVGPYGFRRDFVGRLVAVYLSFLGLTMACGAAGLWLVTTYLLPPEYYSALRCGIVMLAGSMLFALAMLCINYHLAMRRERVVFSIYCLSSAIYAISALTLIPSHSVNGAAWAIVISGIVMAATGILSLSLVVHQWQRQHTTPGGRFASSNEDIAGE